MQQKGFWFLFSLYSNQLRLQLICVVAKFPQNRSYQPLILYLTAECFHPVKTEVHVHCLATVSAHLEHMDFTVNIGKYSSL